MVGINPPPSLPGGIYLSSLPGGVYPSLASLVVNTSLFSLPGG